MRGSEVPKAFRSALGCWEGFRKLGFSSNEISIELDGPRKLLHVVLRTQDKQFVVAVAKCDMGKEEFETKLTAVITAVNDRSLCDEDLDEIWRESLPYKHSYDFVMGILQKGIRLGKSSQNFAN